MKKAFFKKFLLVYMLASAICIVISFYAFKSIYLENQKDSLLSSLSLLTDIYNLSNDKDDSLARELAQKLPADSTIIFASDDGSVFASSSSAQISQNILNLQDVTDALNNNSGFYLEKSGIIPDYSLYASAIASDNSIIRISVYNINPFAESFPLIIIMIFLSLVIGRFLCSFLAKRLTSLIISPISQISHSLSFINDDNYDCTPEVPPHKFEEINQFIYLFNNLRKNIINNIHKLEREKKLEHFIFESMSEGIVLFNENLFIISTNSSATRILECEHEVKGKSIHYLIHNAAALSAIENAVYKKESAILDVNIKNKILAVHVAPVSESLLNDSYGSIHVDDNNSKLMLHGGLMVLTDVTEQRSVEIMRQEFFSNAGHELKTPLTTIIGFAELMENKLVPDVKREYFITKILSESKRMANLISDILEISHLESVGKYEECLPCDILKISQEIKENFTLQAQEKNITITLSGSGFIFNASPKHMHELIENLVSNAVKYNREGGSVAIDVSMRDNLGVISVSDTGIGIPSSSQTRVFERFYRVDKGRSTNPGSTGLGLSIVKHIVTAYGGSISLKSDVGLGTTITISFPLSEQNPQE